jgi:NAD(P) transhydrogenase subunit alpha
MKIAVLKETAEGERRVAATPETIKKLTGLGVRSIERRNLVQ